MLICRNVCMSMHRLAGEFIKDRTLIKQLRKEVKPAGFTSAALRRLALTCNLPYFNDSRSAGKTWVQVMRTPVACAQRPPAQLNWHFDPHHFCYFPNCYRLYSLDYHVPLQTVWRGDRGVSGLSRGAFAARGGSRVLISFHAPAGQHFTPKPRFSLPP